MTIDKLVRSPQSLLCAVLRTGLWGLATACRPAPLPPPQPLTPLPPALAVRPASSEPRWLYEISASQPASELRIEAIFPPGTGERMSVDQGAERFISDVDIAENQSWRRLAPDRSGEGWQVPACQQSGCRLRYRFLLARAAKALDDVDRAEASEGAILATPPNFLLRPTPIEDVEDVPVRLHLNLSPGLRFVTGLAPAPGGAADTYEATAGNIDAAPYSGFGAFRGSRLPAHGSEIEVAIVPSSFASPDAELLRWVQRSADEVSSYFEGFPVPRLALFLTPQRGGGIGLGTTMGHGGASIVVYVGRDANAQDLEDDWVVPHEMIHLSMPPLRRRHRWLKEGIATYVEPIARARLGREKVEEVWDTFLARMPSGLPGWRDQGLDNTHSWGRLYWGGALFCLVADVTIRERSGNRRSLDDALRAIVRAGGNITVSWDLQHVLEEGDRGTGLTVLTDLYNAWGSQPVAVDLPALWRRLGISRRGDQVQFDDHAELAALRQSITAARPPTSAGDKGH